MSEMLLDMPLGASLVGEGVGFKVWAPHADAVSVVGDWNEWDESVDKMTRSEDGNWSCACPKAKAGSQYKFVLHNGEKRMERIDPRAREVTNSVGNSVVYADNFDWEGDRFELPHLNELVVYEIHVRTFAELSAQGNEGKPILDLVCEKLDYLQGLGINALELMPVAEFAGDQSWGYNPSHIFAVESSYGGPDSLKRLVREAHKRGIGVILDVVYNHFGPSDLDIWQFDGWQENEQGGIYFYNDWKAETPWGQTRPDYGRDEVRQYIRDNALMWLTEFRVDGLRYDMTLFIRSVRADGAELIPEGLELIRWINSDARSLPERKVLIAEDLQNDALLTTDIESGGGGFHAQWDAAFVHPVREALTNPEDAGRSMQSICDALTFRYNADAFQRVLYTESHDEVANGQARVVHEIDASNETSFYASARVGIGACLVLTAPGVPMLFQGQEFLEGDWFSDDKQVDWSRKDDVEGMVRLFGDLISARLNKGGESAGLTGQGLEILHCNENANVISYHRWREHGPGDDVIVVINLSSQERTDYRIGFPVAGHWKCLINSASQEYYRPESTSQQGDKDAEPEKYDSADASTKLNLAPYSFTVFSLEKMSNG